MRIRKELIVHAFLYISAMAAMFSPMIVMLPKTIFAAVSPTPSPTPTPTPVPPPVAPRTMETVLNPIHLSLPKSFMSGGESFQFTVSRIINNMPPQAQDKNASTAINTPLNIVLTASDPDGDPLTYQVRIPPAHGTVSIDANIATYTPDHGYEGQDAFIYAATDDPRMGPAIVLVKVGQNPNQPPVIQNQNINLNFSVGTATLSFVASDPDDDISLSLEAYSTDMRGTANLDPVLLTYDHGVVFGHDNIYVRAMDSNGNVTVNIFHIVINDPEPITTLTDDLQVVIASRIGYGTKSLIINTTNYTDGEHLFKFKIDDLVSPSVEKDFSFSIDNTPPLVQWVSKPAGPYVRGYIDLRVNATDAVHVQGVRLYIDRSPIGSLILQEPFVSGYNTNLLTNTGHEFRFDAIDGANNVSVQPAMVSYIVDNLKPTFQIMFDGQLQNSLPITRQVSHGSLSIQVNSTDTLSGVSSVALYIQSGALNVNSIPVLTTTNPQLNYTWQTAGLPTGNYQIYVKVLDQLGNGTPVHVGVLNIAPVISFSQTVQTAEDTSLPITLGSTIGGDPSFGYQIVTNPEHGSFSPISGNNLTYSPFPNYYGTDSFSFLVTNGTLSSNVSMVDINISPVNDAPVLPTIGNQTINEGQFLTLTLPPPTDVDDDALTLSASGLPLGATFDSNTGTLNWIPTYEQAGLYNNIVFTVQDSGTPSRSASKSISILVNNINRAPVANHISMTTVGSAAQTVTLSGEDPDNDQLTYIIVTPPTKGILSSVVGNHVTYTPNLNSNDSDSFTYKVRDGDSLESSAATVSININVVNHPPQLAAIENQIINEAETLSLTISATDPDNDPLTFSASNLPTGASFNPSTKKLMWIPTHDQAGVYEDVRFQVRDNGNPALLDLKTITITVNNKNRKPIANGQALAMELGDSLAIHLTGADPDNDALTFTISIPPVHGVVSGTGPDVIYTPAPSYRGLDSFTFKATDPSVSSSAGIIQINVKDRTAPTVTIVKPTEGENVAGFYSIDVEVTDKDAVQYVEIYMGSELLQRKNAPPYGIQNYETALLPNGPVTLTVKAFDNAGNGQIESRTFNVMNVAPAIQITSPSNNKYVRRQSVPFIVETIGTVVRVDLLINGDAYQMTAEGSDRYQYNWDTIPGAVIEGSYNIIAKAYGLNSLINESNPITVNVDKTPPVVMLKQPLGDRTLHGGELFSVTATDLHEISSVDFVFGETRLASIPGQIGSSTYSYTLDTLNYSGAGQFYAVGIDAAGNEAQTSVLNFVIDNINIPPSTIKTDPHPAHNAYVTNEADAAIWASFRDGAILSTSVTNGSIVVQVTKNGITTTLDGHTDFDNGMVKFTGTIPDNCEVSWDLVGLLDTDGNKVEKKFRFMRTMSRSVGGEVLYSSGTQNIFKIKIPPNALPVDAVVKVDLLTENNSSSSILEANQRYISANEDHRIVAGPYKTYATDANGKEVIDLISPAIITYADLTPPAEAEEQGRVVQIQGLEGALWRPLATSGNQRIGLQEDSPAGARSVTVPVIRFATFRITSIAPPSSGVTQFFNFPNPFSPFEGGTNLSYSLGDDSDVTIVIYDLFGNLVKKFNYAKGSSFGQKGQNLPTWDGRNGEGTPVGNGGYIINIIADDGNGNKSTAKHKAAVVK